MAWHLPTDRLEELVADRRLTAGVPGIAAGIVVDDDLAWFSGQGWADIESRAAPTERSLSRVASVTKTFTMTAVLQLRDRGLLGLDDPLERHLPEFGQAQERGGRRADVTIRRLLTHRSGLLTESPPTNWDAPSFPSTAEIFAAMPETAVVVVPDAAGKYSNLGFALLGEVVARLGGRPYVDYVQGEIFDPLGLDDLTFEPDERRRGLLMTGHLPGIHEDRPRVAPIVSLSGVTAAGQLQPKSPGDDRGRNRTAPRRGDCAGAPRSSSSPASGPPRPQPTSTGSSRAASAFVRCSVPGACCGGEYSVSRRSSSSPMLTMLWSMPAGTTTRPSSSSS